MYCSYVYMYLECIHYSISMGHRLYLGQRDEESTEVSWGVPTDGIFQWLLILWNNTHSFLTQHSTEQYTTHIYFKGFFLNAICSPCSVCLPEELTGLVDHVDLSDLCVGARGQDLYQTGLVCPCALSEHTAENGWEVITGILLYTKYDLSFSVL